MKNLIDLYFFLFGCLVGSFLNVVVLRLPRGKDLVFDRSECPSCKKQLRWYHNIPILSFIFLRGKCGFCGTHISWRYPLIELLTGLCAFGLAPNHVDLYSMGVFAVYFLMACIFICHIIIDLEHHLLLDVLNLYLLGVILPFAILTSHWKYWLVGGLVGFGFPLAVTWLFYKIRGQVGLGGGDIKLFGILGLLLGPFGITMNIFLSCFLGALVGITLIALKKMNKDKPLAFGPAIIVIAVIQIYFPDFFNLIKNQLF